MLGTQTRGGRMEGADEFTEQWRPLKNNILKSDVEMMFRLRYFLPCLSLPLMLISLAEKRAKHFDIWQLVLSCHDVNNNNTNKKG